MMSRFFEAIWFDTKWFHYFFIILFLPISILWAVFMIVRRFLAIRENFEIPIISIGNLQIGGTGKTPFIIELASNFKNAYIVSRGYGRKSNGLIQVSKNGKLFSDVNASGDEAYLMAVSINKSNVIVSEDRRAGIEFAKVQGADVIFLDDGFNQINIEKFEILLKPSKVTNYFPIPSGPFREPFWYEKKADIVAQEDIDFKRVVTFENLTPSMILVTAIANPARLDRFLPKGVVQKYYFDDHAYFNKEKLLELLAQNGAMSLLVTEKDAVKMSSFKLPISKMRLKLEIKQSIMKKIDEFIKGYKNGTKH